MNQKTPPNWPEAVERFNPDGRSDIVLLCEHASNHIPIEYGGLGLSDEDLMRHIAWDPGAASVTRRLSAILDAPAFLGTYSRLLIDLNRPLASPGSIITRSEDTDIPGNLALPETEIDRRIARIFVPYHDAVTAYLNRRLRSQRPTRLVSIHSFTPLFQGTARPWQGGVLFDKAELFGHHIVDVLQSAGLVVAANVPYQTDRKEDYSVPVHGDDRNIPAVLIEVRNDEIATANGVRAWAAYVAASLTAQ